MGGSSVATKHFTRVAEAETAAAVAEASAAASAEAPRWRGGAWVGWCRTIAAVMLVGAYAKRTTVRNILILIL